MKGEVDIMPRETKDAKIARLEKTISMYEESYEILSKRNKELTDAEEGTFLHSPTYLQMKEQFDFVKNLLELTEINLANQKKAAMKVDDTIRQIYEDNKNLVAEKANEEYFVGITENYHAAKEYMKLKDENLRLSAKVETLKESIKEREEEIERLQMLLAEKQIEEQQDCKEEKESEQQEHEEENEPGETQITQFPLHRRKGR